MSGDPYRPTPQVIPTLARVLKDCREGQATLLGLKLDTVKVSYTEHPEFGTEEYEFEGCSIGTLVPFAELALKGAGQRVPTLPCPDCHGDPACPRCEGSGQVNPSQVHPAQVGRAKSAR